ncbi:MAG: hypothetical protein JST55_00580 [Bacteroidetes bacterium]|nr:hypothetical protein [Bacteroidota bacterium]
MPDTFIYGLIGAGIAFLFLVLVKLFSGREKKSKVYSIPRDQQIFAQSTEIYDSSLETKKHIRSAAKNIKMVGEIVPMIESGNKIDAIKYVQQKEQLSLHDAKAFVDEAEEIMHRMPSLFKFSSNGEEKKEVFENNLSQLETKMKVLIENGNLITAIKLYRESSGVGLAEAKEYCEEFARRNNIKI